MITYIKNGSSHQINNSVIEGRFSEVELDSTESLTHTCESFIYCQILKENGYQGDDAEVYAQKRGDNRDKTGDVLAKEHYLSLINEMDISGIKLSDGKNVIDLPI